MDSPFKKTNEEREQLKQAKKDAKLAAQLLKARTDYHLKGKFKNLVVC